MCITVSNNKLYFPDQVALPVKFNERGREVMTEKEMLTDVKMQSVKHLITKCCASLMKDEQGV